VAETPKRIFPIPFKMTTDSLKALGSPEATPVGKMRGMLLLGASLLLDLAFLPPSLAESFLEQQAQRGS
jgi:hypothetical protein